MKKVEQWNKALAAMKANRGEGEIPKSWVTEDKLCIELERLFSEMTVQERLLVERPVPPRRLSIVAHNQKGQLIGYEDLDEEYYDHGGGCGD